MQIMLTPYKARNHTDNFEKYEIDCGKNYCGEITRNNWNEGRLSLTVDFRLNRGTQNKSYCPIGNFEEGMEIIRRSVEEYIDRFDLPNMRLICEIYPSMYNTLYSLYIGKNLIANLRKHGRSEVLHASLLFERTNTIAEYKSLEEGKESILERFSSFINRYEIKE